MDYLIWNIDPNLFTIGSISVRWYGFLFALAFIIGLKIMESIFKKENRNIEELDNGLIYVMVGTVVGARLGHCLFYDPSYYLSNPLEILMIQKGGLASHGGAIGVLIGLYIFAKRYSYSYIWLLDKIVIPTALVGAFIRLGNFFNSEIIGDKSDVPWAIIFSRVDDFPRHPVQLYESFSYLIIFIMLFIIYQKFHSKLKDGFLFGLFMITIFGARFMLEFIKVKQEAYVNDIGFSTGQLLSIPFIILGLYMIFGFKAKK
ncbi:Prolipoprotein diacylglyceryl transferase [hydrothermal vent metagenome]|uniref:Prolipoprotein diacylglyceryl transferase n=1 Tax=hydrothermal vent metagenome TaxID=652676 RepID=A0A1W1EHE7_9ZZZZ